MVTLTCCSGAGIGTVKTTVPRIVRFEYETVTSHDSEALTAPDRSIVQGGALLSMIPPELPELPPDPPPEPLPDPLPEPPELLPEPLLESSVLPSCETPSQ